MTGRSDSTSTQNSFLCSFQKVKPTVLMVLQNNSIPVDCLCVFVCWVGSVGRMLMSYVELLLHQEDILTRLSVAR